MSVQPKGVAEIMEVLAERLPDETLAALFPGQEPMAIRIALREASRSAAAGRQQAESPRMAWRSGPGRASLFTDGAARGNPGDAGAGVLLLDEHGRELAAKSFFLGLCTNNVAEYRALILGLREAGKSGVREISVFLDAELVVRQLLGSYQVKDSKLRQLHAEAMALLRGFDFYQVAHVPREQNRRADQLANLGIDRRGLIGS